MDPARSERGNRRRRGAQEFALNGITQTLRDFYQRVEDFLGKSWPLSVVAILFYAVVAYVLMTRVHFPSVLHFIVYAMGASILVITLVKVEWAVLGLVAMIAFTRPGVSFGELGTFHVSGFNLALIGVWVVYLARYSVDREMAKLGPIVRKTPLDLPILIFLLLTTVSMLLGLNKVIDPKRIGDVPMGVSPQMRMLLYTKEQFLYFAWFFFVVTLTRTPRDLRRLATVFALGGLLVSLVGLYGRFAGAIETVGATEAELESGVVGGRTAASDFLGLGHPNFFGAFLLLTLPIWFFMVDHVKGFFRRLFANVAILIGFLALLFTFSRSAWCGMLAGLLTLGLVDRRALLRFIFFLALFAVVAQGISLLYADMNVTDLVQGRFDQLRRSDFSDRPDIFKSAWDLIRANPIVGVGPGAFPWHADTGFRKGMPVLQAHNVFLTLGAEYGLPATLVWIGMLVTVGVMSVRSFRVLWRTPGYAFVVQGAYAALFAVTAQSFFVYVFADRNVGYAYYTLIAIIVIVNRFIREGQLTPEGEVLPEHATPPPPSRVWVE